MSGSIFFINFLIINFLKRLPVSNTFILFFKILFKIIFFFEEIRDTKCFFFEIELNQQRIFLNQQIPSIE